MKNLKELLIEAKDEIAYCHWHIATDISLSDEPLDKFVECQDNLPKIYFELCTAIEEIKIDEEKLVFD